MAQTEINNFDSVRALIDEHRQLEAQLADPEVHANQGMARKLGRRYAELDAVVKSYNEWHSLSDDLAAARELAEEDSSFLAEVPPLEKAVDGAAADLRALLVPRDPDDGRDAILEIKAGEGGDESALFAGDLLRMYLKYAESRGWRAEVIDAAESGLGGYKDVSVAVKGSSNNPADGVWARMKFEGGVHRVQRVPVTESQGRIHTSAAGVMVFPEVDTPDEVEIHPNELRIDVYRSSGPGDNPSTPPIRLSVSRTSPRAWWRAVRTRNRSYRTKSRPCEFSGRACWPGSRKKRTRPPRKPGARKSEPSTVPNEFARTTFRKIGSSIIGPATKRTTWTTFWTASSNPSSSRAWSPTRNRGSTRLWNNKRDESVLREPAG